VEHAAERRVDLSVDELLPLVRGGADDLHLAVEVCLDEDVVALHDLVYEQECGIPLWRVLELAHVQHRLHDRLDALRQSALTERRPVTRAEEVDSLRVSAPLVVPRGHTVDASEEVVEVYVPPTGERVVLHVSAHAGCKPA
jgi:hypothetical protein